MATLITRLRASTQRKSFDLLHHRALNSTTTKSLQWLLDCKLVDLKRVANAIGSNTGGTKTFLISNLENDLLRERFILPESPNGRSQLGANHNIVSIDMGIRNLAFCRLSLPGAWASSAQPAKPVVHDWTRIAISKRATVEDPVDDATQSATKEAFDPATYAQHAHGLVEKLLLNSHPTQVLIERQRFRSMGGSAVQEWTLRVNMFEAMLYAVLRTLSERGIWSGAVHAVGPAKVSKFWLGHEEGSSGKEPASASSKTKAAKIELVARWLGDRDQFKLEGRATETGQAYLKKRQGTKGVMIEHDGLAEPSASDHSPKVAMGKLDDLADCLLQGMAWVQWEKNRRTILAGGIHALHGM